MSDGSAGQKPASAPPVCPSPQAAGRVDRCGMYAYPTRCARGHCTAPDVEPEFVAGLAEQGPGNSQRNCPHGDPACPCRDGLQCHYEGPDAWDCPGCDHECLSCGVAVPQGGSACDKCRPMMEADAAATEACQWCGRAIKLDGAAWAAVKGEERGYDPLLCDANTDDGRHEP